MPGHTEDFRQIAMQCNGTLREWKQRRFLRDHTIGQRGVCGELATKWIRDTVYGIPFNTTTRALGGREEIMSLAIARYGRNPQCVQYLNAYGITRAGIEAFTRPNAALFIPLQYAKCCILTITRPHVESAHALAGCSFDGRYKFFDPNYGEVTFTNFVNFPTFAMQVLRTIYSEFTGAVLVEKFSVTHPMTPEQIGYLNQELHREA